MLSMQAQINNCFSDLQFNEELHRYKVNQNELISVSKKIDYFVEKVNWDEKASKKAERLGITKESLLQEWKDKAEEAQNRGHRVHTFGELYPFNRSLKPKCVQEEAIVKFWEDIPAWIIPVSMELRMYHKELQFAGTSDLLLFNTRTRKFIIADYKTNEDLFKNFKGKVLLNPFNNLLDCPFNKYQIQLSFYQLLFEQTGYQVERRKVIWLLREDKMINGKLYKAGEYAMFDTEDLTNKLATYLISQN